MLHDPMLHTLVATVHFLGSGPGDSTSAEARDSSQMQERKAVRRDRPAGSLAVAPRALRGGAPGGWPGHRSLLSGLLLGWVMFGCAVSSEAAPADAPAREPDQQPRLPVTIRDPGPDNGYFPNVPDVLPPGGVYLESALALDKTGDPSTRTYTVPLLLRAGIVKDWELRLGVDAIAHEDASGANTTGSGPILVGFRRSFWRADPSTSRPGLGLEAQVQLPVGSSAFNGQRAQPSAQLNFEHLLPGSFSFVWDAGLGWPVDVANESYGQGFLDWALVYGASVDVALTVSGQVAYPATSEDDEAMVLNGFGLTWTLSERVAFTSFFAVGATSESPDFQGEVGFTLSL